MRTAGGTRRDILRGAFAAALAAALAPLVAASGPSGQSRAGDGHGGGSAEPGSGPEAADGFDEMYRGCRIRGSRDSLCGARPAGAARSGAARAASRTASAGSWRVTVDDRPLHLMRRADGGYLTMIDHYQSYPTPLAAARAAVDELGGTLRLRTTVTKPKGKAEAERQEGHGHGVRT